MEKNRRDELALAWSARWSLTARILAVNIFAIALLAGGFFYLDSYRARLIDQRVTEAITQTMLIAHAIDAAPAAARLRLVARSGRLTGTRLRVFGAEGDVAPFDSWSVSPPTYELRDPFSQPWQRKAARTLDRAVDFVVGAQPAEDFVEPLRDRVAAWPEAQAALAQDRPASRLYTAPDRTPVLTVAVPLQDGRAVLLATSNARDITRTVRAERLRLGIVLAAITITSILLSLFLARTIVRPLRRLARAAVRVRLGRAREVQVPRLPERRDEIGLLARALSDMSQTLNQRIDATEAFAADVTHELKNPLASLRSAVDSLARVTDPALQAQLLGVIQDDVHRLDRLITDIAEASRVDAELARASFERVDLGAIIEGLVRERERRASLGDVRVAFARCNVGSAVVLGDGSRLTRVVENLVDNAISFSPPGGLVQIAATVDGEEVLVRIEDEGPGVAPEVREDIFRRFHSIRPEGEAFGRHSGLGLAIAKAIVEGHHGTIDVQDRDEGQAGARFVIRLPVASL